jgi:hypothetical protein
MKPLKKLRGSVSPRANHQATVQDQSELRELGWLQRSNTHIHPARGTVDPLPDAGHKAKKQ